MAQWAWQDNKFRHQDTDGIAGMATDNKFRHQVTDGAIGWIRKAKSKNIKGRISEGLDNKN